MLANASLHAATTQILRGQVLRQALAAQTQSAAAPEAPMVLRDHARSPREHCLSRLQLTSGAKLLDLKTLRARDPETGRLPYGEKTFDAVLSTFDLAFAGPSDLSPQELARVLRAGGRVALAFWPEASDAWHLHDLLSRRLANRPANGSESRRGKNCQGWSRPEDIEALLNPWFDLRFEYVEAKNWPQPAQVWQSFLGASHAIRALINTLRDESVEDLRNQFLDRCHDLRKEPRTAPTYLVAFGERRR